MEREKTSSIFRLSEEMTTSVDPGHPLKLDAQRRGGFGEKDGASELSTSYSTPPLWKPHLPRGLRPPGPPGPHAAALRQGLRGAGSLKRRKEGALYYGLTGILIVVRGNK